MLCNFLLSRGLPVGKEEVRLCNPEAFLCHSVELYGIRGTKVSAEAFLKQEFQEFAFNWSVWDHENASEGDKFFMVRCKNKLVPGKMNEFGKQLWEPIVDDTTGICMAGTFCSSPYKGEDWSGKGRDTFYMDLDIDFAADPDKFVILKSADLLAAIPDFDWKGGHSGRILNDSAGKKLEKMFQKSVKEHHDQIWEPKFKVFID